MPQTALLALALAFQTAPDPSVEFETLCLSTRGEAERVETAALARGYAPVEATQEEEAGSDRADPAPRVWSRTDGTVETRVVSAPGRMRMAGPWQPVHRCYVAAPGDFTDARADAARLTGVESFRQRDTAVFAWTENEAGARASVGQARFERGIIPLLRDRGLQVVLVSKTPDGVTLSYVTARQP